MCTNLATEGFFYKIEFTNQSLNFTFLLPNPISLPKPLKPSSHHYPHSPVPLKYTTLFTGLAYCFIWVLPEFYQLTMLLYHHTNLSNERQKSNAAKPKLLCNKKKRQIRTKLIFGSNPSESADTKGKKMASFPGKSVLSSSSMWVHRQGFC